MKSLLLLPGEQSPRVEFYPNGKLLLEGRSMPADVFKLFEPFIQFAHELDTPEVIFDINLEYFNTSTSKLLFQLLKELDRNKKIVDLLIKWHYESGDENSIEVAEIYEECLSKAKFRYCEYQEIKYVVGRKTLNKIEYQSGT